ncbi:MAG: hypothetical protein IH838_08665 [Proteobacteria bacterium]|nr:hypothetical protein [Pseudomonadota bacterium]
MIQKNTVVLVLGAGASAPYGFPSGDGLVDAIKKIGGRDIGEFLEQSPDYESDHVQWFLEEFQKSGRNSIDRFLQHRSEFSNVGRSMIAYQLMRTEHPPGLFESRDRRWYTYFYNNILNPESPKDFDKNRLRIITYNYDRSFEAFLFSALRSGFDLSEGKTADRMRSVPIIHVHGSFGDLPGMGHNVREYLPNFAGIKQAIHRLNIVSDDIERSGVLEQCGEVLRGASHVVFLGFGFDSVNLGRLQLEENCPDASFDCTAYGFVDSEIEHLIKPYFSARKLKLTYPNPQWDCLTFLRNKRHIFV